MVEGGASVISSFLKSGLVHSVLLTIAPIYVGHAGVSAVREAEVFISPQSASQVFVFSYFVRNTNIIIFCSVIGCSEVRKNYLPHAWTRCNDGSYS
jgi:hypothetical protein